MIADIVGEAIVISPDGDRLFAGPIPYLYERHLVPLIFAPYGADLASRVGRRRPARVLEIAAGTGVVTRQLTNILAPDVTIVATDLNKPMLDEAVAVGTSRPVEWRQADAMQLPFPDESFDVVVCQFGAMFFPDKAKAFAEARRVLRAGGAFIFNVWDRLDQNEFAETVTQALEGVFPNNAPRFMARVSHGYCDAAVVARDLAGGGFARAPEIVIVPAGSRVDSPRLPAIAYCQGTPLRAEIEVRDASRLANVTDIAAAAIARRFGEGVVDGKIQAHVMSVER